MHAIDKRNELIASFLIACHTQVNRNLVPFPSGNDEVEIIINYAEMRYGIQKDSVSFVRGPLVREYLRSVVPGLDGDTSFLRPSSNGLDLECRVVQVGGKTYSPSASSPLKTGTTTTTKITASPGESSAGASTLSTSGTPVMVTSAPAVVTVQVRVLILLKHNFTHCTGVI